MVVNLFFCNFAQKFSMQKRILYIFCLWIATMSIMLSTVMIHHHHKGRICMVEEQCEQDGNINDEHTEHHDQESEGDRENCSVRQMHQFVVLSCSSLLPLPRLSLIPVRWQHVAASPLAEELAAGYSRRGPPSIL